MMQYLKCSCKSNKKNQTLKFDNNFETAKINKQKLNVLKNQTKVWLLICYFYIFIVKSFVWRILYAGNGVTTQSITYV